jgi:hypothetical protein
MAAQVDITDEGRGDLWDRYKYDIPILHLNEQYWTKHRLTAEEVLACTSPLTHAHRDPSG